MDDIDKQKFFADELDTSRDTSIAEISQINPDDSINYDTAAEDDSRYFSVIEHESTLESIKQKDITVNIDSEQSTITDLTCEKSLAELSFQNDKPLDIGSLESIERIALNKCNVHEKIEPVSILSSAVDIFDDNESSVDGHELVIDDDRQPSERSDDFLESGTEMSADMQYKYDADLPDDGPSKSMGFSMLKNSCFQKNTVEEIDNTDVSPEINDIESGDSQSKVDFKDSLSDSEGSGLKVDNYNLPEGSHRVTFQIDGNNVEAINIGQDIYIYTDSNGVLTAFQVIKEDGNCSMKYLHVGKNEDGNIEVYEEQISSDDVESTKEKTPVKDNLLANESEQSKSISLDVAKIPQNSIEANMNQEKKSLSKDEVQVTDITVVKCDLNKQDLSAHTQDILNGNRGIETENSNNKVEETNKKDCVSSVKKSEDVNAADDVNKVNNINDSERVKIDVKSDVESIKILLNDEKKNEDSIPTSEQVIQIDSVSVKDDQAGLDNCEKMELEFEKDVDHLNELNTQEDNQIEIDVNESNLVIYEPDLDIDLQSKKRENFASNDANDLLNKLPTSDSADLVLQTSNSLNVSNDLDANTKSIDPLNKCNNEEHITDVLDKHVAVDEAVIEINNINSTTAQNNECINTEESNVSQITCKESINLNENSDQVKLNTHDDKVGSLITNKDIIIIQDDEMVETQNTVIDIEDENLKSGNANNSTVDLDVESDEDMDDVVEGEPVTGDSEINWLDDEYSKEKTDIADVKKDNVEDIQQSSEVKCVIKDSGEIKKQLSSEVENVMEENIEDLQQSSTIDIGETEDATKETVETNEQLNSKINIAIEDVESIVKQTSIEINSETASITDLRNEKSDIEVKHVNEKNSELIQEASIGIDPERHIECEVLDKPKDECKNADNHVDNIELLVDQTVKTNVEVSNTNEETYTVSVNLFEESNDMAVNSIAILEETNAVTVSQDNTKISSAIQNEESDIYDHPMRTVSTNNIRSYIAKKFKTLKSSATSETGNSKPDVLSNEKIHTLSLSDNMLNSAKDSLPKVDVNVLENPNTNLVRTHSKDILGEYIGSHSANSENSIVLQSSNLNNLQIVDSPLLIITDNNVIMPVLDNYSIEDNTVSKIEITNCNVLNVQKSPSEATICEPMPKNRHRQPRKQIFTPVARSDIEMIFPDTDDIKNEPIARHKPKCYGRSKSKTELDNSVVLKSTAETDKSNNKKDIHKTNIKPGALEIEKDISKNDEYSQEYEKIISTNTENEYDYTVIVESNSDLILNNKKTDVDTSSVKDDKDIEALKNEKDVNVALMNEVDNKELSASKEEVLGSCESVKNTADINNINVTPNSAKRKRGRPKKAVSTDLSTFESLIFNVDGSPSKITIDSYSHHNSFAETKITSPTKETVTHVDENNSHNEEEKLNISLSDSEKKKKGRPRKLLSASLSDIDKIDTKANSSFKNLSLCNNDKIAKLCTSKSDENMNEPSIINIEENVCPICSKNFRSKNVLLKHAKHCNGAISVELFKSPKKRKLESNDNKTKTETKVNEINNEKGIDESLETHTESEDTKLHNVVEEKNASAKSNEEQNVSIKSNSNEEQNVSIKSKSNEEQNTSTKSKSNEEQNKVNKPINTSCEIIDDDVNTNKTAEIIIIEDEPLTNIPKPTAVSEKVDKNTEKYPKPVIPRENKRIINKTKNAVVSTLSEKNVKKDVAPSPMTRLSKILRTKCPINIIKCEVCGKIFKQLAHKISHKKKFHPEVKPPTKILEKVQDIETENNQKIKESRYCSESEAILKCETCNKGFRKLHHLVEHRELHINNEIKSRRTSVASVKSEPEGGFRCEACGKSFRKLHHLVEHRELHSSDNNAEQNLKQPAETKMETKEIAEENTTCSCGKSFRKRYHMIEHRDIHCSPNKIRKENDEVSSRDQNVRLSFTSSTSEDSNNCGICGKSYRKLHHMVEHRESHTEAESKESVDRIGSLGALNTKDIIHECSRCYMVFPNINALNKHTAICLNKKTIKKVLNVEANADKSSIKSRRKSSISVTSSLSVNTNKSEATISTRSSRTPESRTKPVPLQSTSKIPLATKSKEVETSDDETDVRYKINTDFNIRYKINPAFRRNSVASRKSLNLQSKAPVTKLRKSSVPTLSVRKSIENKEAKRLEIYEENVVRYSFPKPLNSINSSDVVKRNSRVTKSSILPKKSAVIKSPQKIGTKTSIANRKDARKIHKCDCGKSFENNVVLKRHIDKEHTPPKSFKCQKCGVSLRTAVQYRKHTLAHETENKNLPSVQAVAGTSKAKKTIKYVSSDESQSKTPSTAKRRRALHGGVPLSEKMKKAIAKANFKI